ncbi:serum response factor blistered isoform X2 [Leptinotarsa decemlineata]|uniref:serum response factor blistered isoform X2 n=1 Tax=Leptinotarsa decemlineata TaxID=7539 RepID=UPI003D309C0A
MEPPGGRDSRFNLGYSMNLLSSETPPEIYGNPNLGRPSTSLQQMSPRHTMVSSACNRGLKSDLYDERGMSSQGIGLDSCVNDISDDTYSMQSKKSPPNNGKKTKGRVKIKMEYIENKLRRYTTFSKRKTGIMKKAYELSTLTGTQVMLLVASETGHVYTFATRKLQPMITSEAGKALIQTCLNSPDPPAGSAGGDQRMSATGFEETELTYNISDDDSKDAETGCSSSSDEGDPGDEEMTASEKMRLPSHSLSFEATPKGKVPEGGSSEKIADAISTIEKGQNIQPTINVMPSTSATVSTPSKGVSISMNNTPLILPTTGEIANFPAGLSSLPLPGTSSSQVQAVPFLLQTPNGIGYASTPEGMILGLLQGPNITQPQIVAIPIGSLSSINSETTQNQKKSENRKT